MKKFSALLAATAVVLAGQARAEEFSYTYLDFDIGYAHGTSSADAKSGAAMRFAWAYEFWPDVYLLLDGGGTSYDVYDADLDEDVTLSPGVFSLGLGYAHSLAPNLDLTAGVSWDTLSLEVQLYDEFRNARYFHGWGVNLGLRGRIGKRVQWNAGTHYSHVERVHSIPAITLGGRYFITRGFAMGLEGFLRRYNRDPVDLKESGAMLIFSYEWADRH